MKLLSTIVVSLLIGCATFDSREPQSQQIAKQPMQSLCNKCSRQMVTCDIGSCDACGEMTTSGCFSLCDKCSIKLDQCGNCRKSILNEPADDLDEPRAFIVSVESDENSPSVRDGFTRAQVLEAQEASMTAFSTKFRAWLDENDLKNVTIDKQLNAVRCLFITCSINQSKKIEKFSGVHVARGD